MNIFVEIYKYRQMIASFVKRDLKGRYKASVLGFLWTFINPLLQLLVYTMVFSVIMRAGIKDYYLFLFVALIPWIFFASSVSGGAGCVVGQSAMVTKIYFPREVLPISYVLSNFVNMLLSFLVVFAVLIVAGKPINFLALLYLPLIMLIEFMLALGLAMISSAVSVYFRDLEYILSIVVMAWQFLTPIMYSQEMIQDETILKIFMLNPMTSVIIAYRDILYYGKVPDVSTLLLAAGMGVGFLILGFLVFGRLKRRFAEEL
ncbi:MAG TPA: ABC transporter permease [Bacillota bacterium]|nr:ABC transporter permease [Bacillota bacterium]HPE38375.1 ABC transporter permease [Bacillota bacterium]